MKRTLYDTDHLEFGSSAQEFINSVIAPRHDTIIEQKLIDRDIWIEAGKLGFLGLGIPACFGGGEANDFRFNSILTEKLSGAAPRFRQPSASTPTSLPPTSLNSRPRRKSSTGCRNSAVAKLLPPSRCLNPPLVPISPASVRSPSATGPTGSSMDRRSFITNGTSADLIICAAKTSPKRGAKGITLFALEVPAEGFTRGRKLDTVGQPESDTAELFFDDLIVSDENVIGQVDQGLFHMMDMLPLERLNAAIANLAHARAISTRPWHMQDSARHSGRRSGRFLCKSSGRSAEILGHLCRCGQRRELVGHDRR